MGVRVVSQTKSRKIPTRKILPLFFVIAYWEMMPAMASMRRILSAFFLSLAWMRSQRYLLEKER